MSTTPEFDLSTDEGRCRAALVCLRSAIKHLEGIADDLKLLCQVEPPTVEPPALTALAANFTEGLSMLRELGFAVGARKAALALDDEWKAANDGIS